MSAIGTISAFGGIYLIFVQLVSIRTANKVIKNKKQPTEDTTNIADEIN